jgi:hypothetical protein
MLHFALNLEKIIKVSNLSQAAFADKLSRDYNLKINGDNIWTYINRGISPRDERVIDAIADFAGITRIELINKELNIQYLETKMQKEDKTLLYLQKTNEFLMEEVSRLRGLQSKELEESVKNLSVWVKATFLQILRLRGIDDIPAEAHKTLDEVLKDTFLKDNQ